MSDDSVFLQSGTVLLQPTPDGKPWVSFKLPTQEAGDDELVKIKGPDLDENEIEKKAITQTGLFPFKITLKNALAGMILPVKVIGTGDGQWDANAWKADAFYGNPLSGFSVP